MSRCVSIGGLLALVAPLCACGTGSTACTADFRYGLIVTVLDASTGARICNARVAATDGAYQETLTTSSQALPAGGIECAYQGAGKRAGTYSVNGRLEPARRR